MKNKIKKQEWKKGRVNVKYNRKLLFLHPNILCANNSFIYFKRYIKFLQYRKLNLKNTVLYLWTLSPCGIKQIVGRIIFKPISEDEKSAYSLTLFR